MHSKVQALTGGRPCYTHRTTTFEYRNLCHTNPPWCMACSNACSCCTHSPALCPPLSFTATQNATTPPPHTHNAFLLPIIHPYDTSCGRTPESCQLDDGHQAAHPTPQHQLLITHSRRCRRSGRLPTAAMTGAVASQATNMAAMSAAALTGAAASRADAASCSCCSTPA